MKRVKVVLLVLLIVFNAVLSAGCWNYREIDRMSIVAGIAIDTGSMKKYCISTEIIQTTGGKESKTTSTLLSAEGDSIFEAVRNMISTTGKRLYWSHAKVVIISEPIARQGIIDVLDWISRDSETRADIHILVSMGIPAVQILQANKATEEVQAFELNDIITAQKSLGKAPEVEIWRFSNDLESKGVSAIAATVAINHLNNEEHPILMGTAVFKSDKLVGFLSGEETMALLMILNRLKGGVLVYEKQGEVPASLEIFHSKTKVKPVVDGEDIEIKISNYTETALDEIMGSQDYIEDEGRKKLEQSMGQLQEENLKKLIKKVQTQYKVDIFGFGSKLNEDDPKLWKQISKDWEDKFPDLKINVSVTIHIRNSAMLSKPLIRGD